MVKIFQYLRSRNIGFILFLNLACCVALVSTSIYLCRKGFEFTDEGYYLQSIASPDQYNYGVSQFGFFLHPLYLLVGENLVFLRVFNVFLTEALSFYLCLQIFSNILLRANCSKFFIYATSGITSVVSLNFFSLGIFTPSYNSLNFQLCISYAIGINSLFKKRNETALLNIAFIGSLIAVSILNKVTTGLVLMVVTIILIELLTYRKLLRFFTLLLAMITTFLTIGILIDGNVADFWARLTGGMKISQLMGHHFADIFKLYTFHPNRADLLILIFIVFLLLFIPSIQKQKLFFAIVIISVLLITYLIVQASSSFTGGQFRAIWIAGLPIYLILFSLLTNKWSAKVVLDSLSPAGIFWRITLFFLPLIFAFGTNNNYWEIGSWVSLFTFICGLEIYLLGSVVEFNQREFAAILFLSTVLVTHVFLSSVTTPYRQDASLFSYRNPLSTFDGSLQPFVSADTAGSISQLQMLLLQVDSGIDRPLGIIDLTGQSPGMIFASGAKTVGQPWLAGGYTGSEAAMRWVLNSLSEYQRSNSLVLIETLGTRSLNPQLLTRAGSNSSMNYSLVGKFAIRAGTGFDGIPRHFELFEPKNTKKSKTSRIDKNHFERELL